MTSRSAATKIFLNLFTAVCATHSLANETKAQLFIPWNLIEARLQSAVAKDNTNIQTNVPDTKMNFAGFEWTLSEMQVQARLSTDLIELGPTDARVSLRDVPLTFTLGKISVDQVIERVISGVIVRVRLQAQCGPIQISQAQANAQVNFAIDWASGEPRAALASFQMGWTPDSWILGAFNCTGPEGFGEVLHKNILDHLSDPEQFRDLVSKFVAGEVERQLAVSLRSLKEPFKFSETANGTFRVGILTAAETGVVADISIGAAEPGRPTLPKPLPSLQVLGGLSQTQPSLLADMSTLEFFVVEKLVQQPELQTIDLQANSSFRSLIKSRFLQFFVWQDLFNYSKSSPFYVRLKTPRAIDFTFVKPGVLKFPLPISAVVQSYRDNQWWNYIDVEGSAEATTTVALLDGKLTYVTAIDSVASNMAYSAAYVAKYKKPGGFPKKKISAAMKGGQEALSGTIALPEIDLGGAGAYRAQTLLWLDRENFVVSLAPLLPN